MPLKKADQEKLYHHVHYLTSIYPYRNYKNIESLRIAADYIDKRLQETGLATSRQKWEAKGNTYENILASFLPEKSKRFIIGAHYDVYKEQPGADDNASSVAGLLEIARLLKQNKPKLDYGIDLVSFCLEEPPFFKKKEMGSYVHANSVYAQKQEIIGMISMEMIGYYRAAKSASTNNTKYLIVSGIRKHDDFNKRIAELLRENTFIQSRKLSYADDYRNNGPSDHRNYWPFGYPAAMVIGTGGAGNPHYPRKSDTIETLDFEIMTEAVNNIYHALVQFEK